MTRRTSEGMTMYTDKTLSPYQPEGATRQAQQQSLIAMAAEEYADDHQPPPGEPGAGDSDLPAGYTYLAQFVTHDLSFDLTPAFEASPSDTPSRNARTTAFDLDSLYGLGPRGSAALYDHTPPAADDARLAGLLFPEGHASFETNDEGGPMNPHEADLPRVSRPAVRVGHLETTYALEADGTTVTLVFGDPGQVVQTHAPRAGRFLPVHPGGFIHAARTAHGPLEWFRAPRFMVNDIACGTAIGDPRNDDNVLVAHTHLALARFHNRLLRGLALEWPRWDRATLFATAQRAVRWHYQWLVVHDLLPRWIGRPISEDDLLRPERTDWLKHRDAFVPSEFIAGGLRAGHVLIRERYQLNALRPRPVAFTSERWNHDTLRGQQTLPPRWSLQWDLFVGENAQRARRFTPRIAPSLRKVDLPGFDEPVDLPSLDLLRAWKLELPSGQALARALDIDVPESLQKIETPLPLYVLQEAERQHDGAHLGSLGSRILLDTVAGLLKKDDESYLAHWSRGQRWNARRHGLFRHDTPALRQLIDGAGLPFTAEEHRRSLREPWVPSALDVTPLDLLGGDGSLSRSASPGSP